MPAHVLRSAVRHSGPSTSVQLRNISAVAITSPSKTERALCVPLPFVAGCTTQRRDRERDRREIADIRPRGHGNFHVEDQRVVAPDHLSQRPRSHRAAQQRPEQTHPPAVWSAGAKAQHTRRECRQRRGQVVDPQRHPGAADAQSDPEPARTRQEHNSSYCLEKAPIEEGPFHLSVIGERFRLLDQGADTRADVSPSLPGALPRRVPYAPLNSCGSALSRSACRSGSCAVGR